MIAIIDYDAGNLKSVEKALQFLGAEPVVSSESKQILSADHIILPGVGAFGDAMQKLRDRDLVDVICEAAAREIPLLGICLGLQLLFKESEETPGVKGLGLLEGKILRIPDQNGTLKVPQIGWNQLDFEHPGRLYQGIPEKTCVYFVHSYYLKAKDESVVSASTDYGVRIHASVEKGSLFATQFHPEKSGKWGLEILNNFIHV